MSNGTSSTKKTGRPWAYAGAILGGAVSIAANVAHSYVPPATGAGGIPLTAKEIAAWSPELGAVIGAVFWPLALFVAVEILARIAWPAGRRWLALRFLGLLPVALVAAVVSYRHLSGLLAHYGEDSVTTTFGPLAVDGLMIMATGALIATGRTLASRSADLAPAADPVTVPAPVETAATATEHAPAKTKTGRKTSKRDTGTAVAALVAKHPDLTREQIAKRLGITDRTVRRYLNNPTRVGHTDPMPASLAAVS